MRKYPFVSALVMVLTLCGSGAALAAPQTVTIDDPVGDAANNRNTNGLGNEKGPGYFDLTGGTVTGDAGTFTMSMRLAAPMPLTPPDPKGDQGSYFWAFLVDTDPNTSPSGYPFPFASGAQRLFEYVVFLTWDGIAFDAYIVDRTPLLSDGEATITDIPFLFNTDRTELTFVFDEALVGSPTTFIWQIISGIREAHYGTEGFQSLDIASANWP